MFSLTNWVIEAGQVVIEESEAFGNPDARRLEEIHEDAFNLLVEFMKNAKFTIKEERSNAAPAI